MSWDSFVWFALAASLFWISGAIVSVISKRMLPAAVLAGCGSAIFMTFIVGVWISLGRPPLRTMGGDPPLVQPVPFADRTRGVSSLALPLGTSVRMPDGRDVRQHQHIQARDSH